MDILQQSLEAADILSPEGVDSELPDELMLELTQIDSVSSTEEVYSNTQTVNGNVAHQGTSQIYQSNMLTQNVVNATNQSVVNQPQIISTNINNVQPVQNKIHVVGTQQQNLGKTQQVMLVPSTHVQQNGVYQIVNVPTQQQSQGGRKVMPIKPMFLQQSNVNGRYTVSPLNVNSNNINIVRASPNQVISSCSSLTSYTNTNTIGQTVTTCSAVYSKLPSQIVTTTPSSSLFATKLPPGIRVVQHLLPTKGDGQTKVGQHTNIIGSKILTYPGNTTKVVTLNNNVALQQHLTSQGVLHQNSQTVTVVKPQLQHNTVQKTQFVKLDSKLPQRNNQVPIKGIQIASVNIPVGHETNNYTNGITTLRNSPKVVLSNPNKTQNVIAKSNVQNVSLAPNVINVSPKGIIMTQTNPKQKIITPINNRTISSQKIVLSPQVPKVVPSNIQVFRVDASLTEEQAEEVRNLIVSRTIVNKMRTLAHEQQQLVLAFQAQIRTMSLPVQQYYLRNPQLFVQKVLQVTSTGKPFIIQVKKNSLKSANNNAVKTTVATTGVTQDKATLNHPTISLVAHGEKREVSQFISKPVEVRQAVKRPASSVNNSLSLILEQMECHKKIVLAPNCSKPFATTREALRRLLPYHIYNLPNIETKHFEESDALMEEYSDKMKERIQRMYDKYHLLCLRDVTRKACSAEVVMVERIFLQQEKASFAKDKIKIAQNPDCISNFFPKVKSKDIKKEIIVKQENPNDLLISESNDGFTDNQSDSESDSNPPSSSNQSYQHHSSVTNQSDSSDHEDSLLQAAVDSIL